MTTRLRLPALVLAALLSASAVAAADPVTHWRTVAGKALVHHVDKAKDTVSGLEVPDAQQLVQDAPGQLQRAAEEARAAAEEALPALPPLPALPALPGLPDAGATVEKGKAIAQHWATYAVRMYEKLT